MSEFTTDWFTKHLNIWNPLLAKAQPKKILEIGSFEGRSTCYMIENASKYHDGIEIHCVDTWRGSPEHGDMNFDAVEARFDANVKESLDKVADKNVKLVKHKGTSLEILSKLVVEGHLSTFDWVLVDGSHMAVDVLYDAILAFRLVRVGGVIIFDDWNVQDVPGSEESLDYPMIAIRAFGMIYREKTQLIRLIHEQSGTTLTEMDTYQLYLMKTSE